MKRWAYFVLALAALFVLSTSANAAYPDRPIHIIVPYPPGAGNDLLARTIGQKLSDALGQTVVIDNRPGAGGNVGTETAARAAPDGYTLLMFNNAQTINASLNPKLPFDVRNFVGVSMLATTPILLAGSKKFEAKTIQDVVRLAKEQPGKINFGSAGYGTPQHFGGELLNMLAGIKLIHVPYRGQAASTQALISNEVELSFGTLAGLAPMVQSDLIRPIAIAGAKRASQFPDVPTIAESGYPSFDIYIWYGFVAPKGTPPDVVKKLNEELGKILANPDNRADLAKKGFEAGASTPQALTDFIAADLDRWKKLVLEAHMPLQQQ